MKSRALWSIILIVSVLTVLSSTSIQAQSEVEDAESYEIAAAQQQEVHGKLSPQLYELLQSKSSEDTIKVNIWLKSDATKAASAVAARYPEAKLVGQRPSKDTNMALYQRIRTEMNEAMKQANKSSEQPVVEFVQTEGFEVFGLADYAPVVFAELSKDVILKLEKRTDVDTIYNWRDDYSLPLDDAAPTIGAPEVWSSGYTGGGIKVAIIDISAIDFTHPALVNSNGGYHITPDPDPEDPDEEYGHATVCAGPIASQDVTYKGIAPDATLLSGNLAAWGDDYIVEATEWAIDNGADIIVPEFQLQTQGVQDFIDRYYDHVVAAYSKSVIVPAGNEGQVGPLVASPAIAYNVLSVGNFFDHNNSDWNDDIMGGSSYIDPSSGGEKPEVAAPGTAIMTTSAVTHDFVETGGTSLAAPMVAGEAALLMQQNSILKAWPELTRAIIMASAIHNIEGDSKISDKDGVGGISASAASNVLSSNQWAYNILYKSSFPEGSFSQPYYIFANEGDTVRAVLSWICHPDNNDPYNYPDPVLSTNLDLYAYAPDDSQIDYSASSNRSWEIIEFDATVTGYYNVKIKNSQMSRDWERFGLAWDVQTTFPPDIPTLVSPTDGATGLGVTPYLVFNYSDPDNDNCTMFDLKVDDNPNLLTPVINEIDYYDGGPWSSGDDITYQVPSGLLEYDTQYYWAVRVFDVIHWSYWSDGSWDFTTISEPQEKPDIPTLVSPPDGATDVSLTPELVFTYSDMENDYCTKFALKVDDDPDFDSLEINETNYTSGGPWSSGSNITYHVASGLLERDTKYYWKVNVFDGTDWSGFSDGTWDFTTTSLAQAPPDPPIPWGPPHGSSGVAVDTDLVFKYCDPNNDYCTKYNLQVADNPDFILPEIDEVDYDYDGPWPSDSIIRYYPLYYLSYGTTYYWRVNVFDGTEWSGWPSTVWYFTTEEPVPPLVTTGTANLVSLHSATLNGDLTSLGTATTVDVSFEWGLTTNYGNTTESQPMTATGPFSIELTGLEPDTTYHFRAKAEGHGISYGEEEQFTTSAAEPQWEILRPNAAGSETNITSQEPSSGSHWDKVDEASPDTSTTVSENGPSYKRDLYNLPSPTGSGTINFIKIYFRCVTVGLAGTCSAKPSLMSSSTKTDGSAVTLTTTWTTYSQQWNTNPADGGAWEWADIDDLQIGVSLAGAVYNTARCTQVYVEINYEDSEPTPPVVTNSTGASDITADSARLNGEITDTGGENPTVHIYWGTSDGGTTPGNWDNDEILGVQGVGTFYADISGLTADTDYYYRCYAENSAGGSWADSTELFTTAAGGAPPSVTTDAASGITTNSATLNGNLDDLGTATTVDVSFEWGETTSYGNTTTPQPMTATGPFSIDLTDLEPDTTYHFRAKAEGDGTSYGSDQQFTTGEPAPQYEILRPNAAGDETNLGPYPNTGEENWEDVDDVTPDDDTTRVKTMSSTYLRDLYNLPAHTGSGTINFIKIYFRCKHVGIGPNGVAKPSLKSNTTVTDGTEVTLTTSYVSYSQQWNTNPADGGAWEWADIDALQIGVSLKGLSGFRTCRCTQIYVEIEYEE